MKRMFSRVVVVEDDLDNIALFEHMAIGVVAVHLYVSSIGTSCQNAI